MWIFVPERKETEQDAITDRTGVSVTEKKTGEKSHKRVLFMDEHSVLKTCSTENVMRNEEESCCRW